MAETNIEGEPSFDQAVAAIHRRVLFRKLVRTALLACALGLLLMAIL